MADDKHSDSVDGSDESTSLPTGAELADEDLPEGPDRPDADPVDPELSADREIVDDEPGDGYVDDPATDDINEAKLERATDEVADETTADPGSTAQRRPRSARPRRRDAGATTDATEVEVTGSEVDVDPDGDVDEVRVDEAAELEPTPAAGRRRTVAKKDHATPTRRSQADESRRTGPVQFVNQSVAELRKVVWPTATQVQQYFVVVLVFVLFIIAFVSLLDLGFGWLLLKVFG